MLLLEGFVVVLEWFNSSTVGGVVVGLLFCLAVAIVGAAMEE